MKEALIIFSLAFILFMTGNAQSYQKTDLGVKSKVNAIDVEMQFYSPSTVRVTKWPEGKAFTKESLSVTATPQKTSFTINQDGDELSMKSKNLNVNLNLNAGTAAPYTILTGFDIVKERSGDDPLKIFKKAVENVKPSLEVKSRRVGGSNYQVPVEVNPNRRLSLSIRWLVGFARQRGDGKTMQEKLANELMDAANLRGGAVKKREDTHRMAEANKAFAHYRW
jgi:small subunit ribosomal protein S7